VRPRANPLQDLPAPNGRQGWPWSRDGKLREDHIPGEDTRVHRGPPVDLRPNPTGMVGREDSESSALGASPIDLPRVSVVVPSYNQGRFIEETIRSVLLQDYPNLELIVMDGGSRDGTVSILQRYDSWIHCWLSEPDRGQTHAINKGLARATGEIFTYLNSDDLLHPGAVTRVVDAFQRNPDVAVVHGECVYVDEAGGELFRRSATVDGLLDYLRIWERFATGNYITQPEAFIRREALTRVGEFREDLHSVMDFEMWLRLLSHGYRFLAIPGAVAHFRTYPAQKSSVDPGYELFRVIKEYAQSPHPGIGEAERRALFEDLAPARSQILLRAAITANILDDYPKAVRYSLAAAKDHPRIASTYLFWSVLSDPLKRAMPERYRARVRRLFQRS
jgi:glycosyltransferase involved in cell wall biosynthesis